MRVTSSIDSYRHNRQRLINRDVDNDTSVRWLLYMCDDGSWMDRLGLTKSINWTRNSRTCSIHHQPGRVCTPPCVNYCSHSGSRLDRPTTIKRKWTEYCCFWSAEARRTLRVTLRPGNPSIVRSQNHMHVRAPSVTKKKKRGRRKTSVREKYVCTVAIEQSKNNTVIQYSAHVFK
jgi:hypothetical protein